MEQHEKTLGNGLRVVVTPRPTLHRVAVGLFVGVGSRFESEADNGISHFLEHMLYRGTARHPSAHAQNLAFERIGGALSATTHADHTHLAVVAPPSSLAESMQLLGEVVRMPRLGEIDVERRIVREEILDDLDENGRQVDPDNVVWWEPQQLSAGLALPTFYKAVSGEPNLGYSWHNYCSAVFLESAGVPLANTDSCRAFTTNRESHAVDQAATLGAVPLMTEWGATDNVNAVRIDADVADEFQMGWMYWAYKHWDDPTTADSAQGLFTDDADLGSVKADKLRQLVRTYPQATAGTLEGYDYDPDTGRFTMSYRADPSIRAPTRIFVSPLTSPHGYDVAATGGTVSTHGSYVDLEADTAEEIQVTITPRP
jgi:hypothetical protein